jgi:ABC-type transport system involved in cytochrome c biogenesis permease subunit
MDLPRLLPAAVFALYTCGAVFYILGLLGQRTGLQRLANGCAFLGFAIHSALLAMALSAGPGLAQALSQTQFYFSLLSWVLLLTFFLLWWRLRIKFLALVISPLALALFTSSIAVASAEVKLPSALSGLFFGLHIGALFASIALLAVAFGSGAIFIHMERKIKTKEKLTGFRKDLPSLSSFDRANHLAVLTGFPLYTLGLISGFVWAGFTWGRVFSWDPKELATLTIWLMFAVLFHQRLALGWKGRKPARLTIWVFAFTVVSLVGINFLLPTHHSFKP